jgi:hypothetical protein
MEYWGVGLETQYSNAPSFKYHREVIGNDVERLHKHRKG